MQPDRAFAHTSTDVPEQEEGAVEISADIWYG